MPWKLKRTLLIGHILNVALSGVEAYALQNSDYETLQAAVTKIFRSAMGKRAVQLSLDPKTQEYKVENRISNAAVLKYWKISTIRTELAVRRIRMYQSLAANPQDSVLPMAAAFGRIHGDSTLLQPPVLDGRITKDATPWAKQFQDDMEFWCDYHEEANELFQPDGYKFFEVFTNQQKKMTSSPLILPYSELGNGL